MECFLKLRSQEIGGFVSIAAITEVRSQNGGGQVSIADSVANQTSTEDLVIIAREVGDLSAVPTPLSVAEAHSCLDLILDFVLDVLDSAVNNGSALTID